MYPRMNHLTISNLSGVIQLIIYCLPLISVFFLCGCVKDGDVSHCDKETIEILPAITGGRVTGDNFDTGDQIGLYAVISPGIPAHDNYANNVAYTFNGAEWSLSGGYFLPWPGAADIDLYAYWPYDEGLSGDNPRSYPFSISSDQSTEEKYIANDFLWAKSTGQSYGEPVPLLFSHLMARTKINIHSSFNAGDIWPGEAKVSIIGLLKNMSIDLSDGGIIPLESEDKHLPPGHSERVFSGILTVASEALPQSEEDVIPLVLDTSEPGYDVSLAAIVMPQEIQGGNTFIRIVLDDLEFVFIPSENFSFIPGENLTINLNLIDDRKPKGVRAEPDILSVDENGILNLDGRGHIVYFKWGSSVAVYGRENTYLFDGKEDIAWIPPGFDIETITGAGSAGWGQIPFSTNTTTYPDRINSADVTKGLGDPCQFAVKNGEVGNYRIPRGSPYEQFLDGDLDSDYNGIAGRWSNYGSNKSQFYPFTGRILDGGTSGINVRAYYWSGTGSGNEGYTLSVSSSSSTAASYWRDYGLAIRCVRK